MQNGRLKGAPKKALRQVIEAYGLPVTLTANQNIILRDVEPAWKADIQAALEVRCGARARRQRLWGRVWPKKQSLA